MKKISTFLAVITLLLILNSSSYSQQQINVKSYIKFLETSQNSLANKDLYFARNVKVVRFYGNDTIVNNYTIIGNNDKKNPYCGIVAETYAVLITKNTFKKVNYETQELSEIPKNKGGKRYYKSLRWTEGNKMQSLFYYHFNVPKIEPINPTMINGHTQLVTRGKNNIMFTACREQGANNFVTSEFWIDENTCEIDSVVQISTLGNVSTFWKEYVTPVQDFNYNGFEKLFDFNDPQYKNFSKHDQKNLPYSNKYTTNEMINEDILNFPITNLKGEQTTLSQMKGWVLFDFWQFGCRPCFEQFKKFAHERDSIGSTILENEGVKILSIHPYSDNLEMIGQVGDKFNVSQYLFSAKGMNDKISVTGYPTYYLISPDKKAVLKTTHLGDYSEILQAIKNYQ